MNIEENRLRTFASWPSNAAISAERLAKAGFYYSGRALKVQCFICGVAISEWNYGDQAMSRHREAYSNCPFVICPSDTCNVPMMTAAGSSRRSTSPEAYADSSSSLSTAGSSALYSLSERLKTFQNWPIPFVVSPDSLSRAGFYCLRDEAKVKCAYCCGVITKWNRGDDPNKKHRLFFPDCPFYVNYPNIVEDALFTDEVLAAGNPGLIQLQPGAIRDLGALGVQKHTAPRIPYHSTYEGRLKTFETWPENLKQTPQMMAIAGFYYCGNEDAVRCFHCAGGLRSWEETDDAWTEHARWFPKCGFVTLVRGPEFIKHSIDNRRPLDPSILLGMPEDENEDVMAEILPSPLPINARASVREISDSEVENLLSSEPAMAALEIGLNVGRVKMALKQRMEATGVPYANADELIEAVRHVQLAEESEMSEPIESSSSELSNLEIDLRYILTREEKRQRKLRNSDSPEQSASGVEPEKSEMKTESSSFERLRLLEQENRRLKEARLCKICMDREVSVVFLPCGHLATCVQCAPSLTHCPMCRHEIRAIVRTFLA